MDRNEILAVFLLFLIVADVSNARFRDLAAAPTNESATPVSNSNNELDQKPIGADKSNETKSEEVSTQLLNGTNLKTPNLTTEGTGNGRNSSGTNSGQAKTETTDKEKNPQGLNGSHTGVMTPRVDNANTDNGNDSKSSNSTDSTMSPPGNGTNPGDLNAGTNSKTSHRDRTKEKNNGDNNSSDLGVDETCTALTNKCRIKMVVACIKSFDEGSGNLSVLVQNEGEKPLRVKLTIPSAVENPTKQLKVSKNQTQMCSFQINISLAVGESPKVILNTENKECLLPRAPLESEENAFLHLPSYDNLLTPINGAYFLILSVLVFGGTWACCKFRKRKWHGGVPYQELEMGLPDTASAVTVESAEGWDQGWDDDWDEENSVKSPGASRVGNISANGLTSRSSNKDGWENDWDN